MDIEPQPHYPFEFIQADALTVSLEGFDAYAASPPCQQHSRLNGLIDLSHYPDLIDPIRQRLNATDKPYIIENVVGAPMINPITLCGEMFGLKVIRHRLFESNVFLLQPPHPKHKGTIADGTYFPVYGHGWSGGKGQGGGAPAGACSRKNWQASMGITWEMTQAELANAIPPAYTEFLGSQLIKYV